ncbi:hypothetical protein E3J74_01255 [Candidatus Bathyarchaeota archaeon]|nr:MAG: hypothetical protein E3J74_01255 [Candidatus Bathyarchaeota archaeon]
MPMLRDEKFLARLQRGNRIQVPVLIMWKHKLNAREVLRVRVWSNEAHNSQSFYVRLSKDGRFRVPKIVVEELELEPGTVLGCTLYSETAEGE